MKNIGKIILLLLLTIDVQSINAQSSNLKTQQIKVLGNCEMCKSVIEKSGRKRGEAKVKWDSNTKIAELTYDSSKQTADDILKRIALAGYDNEKFLAPDEAYSKLPECCKYLRSLKKDKSAKTMTENTYRDSHPAGLESTGLENLFSAYFDLKDAFVQSDEKSISAKAASLSKQISTLNMSELKTDQHEAWMKVNQQLKTLSSEIVKTDDIDKKRVKFSQLSQELHKLAKVAHLNYEMYFQHCPMFNNGADWLSKDEQIKNPFYGNQMLTCGKTVETIK